MGNVFYCYSSRKGIKLDDDYYYEYDYNDKKCYKCHLAYNSKYCHSCYLETHNKKENVYCEESVFTL